MKRLAITIGLPLLTAAIVGTTSVTMAGIKGSKHDLGSGGGAQFTTSSTTEVCVFCHTPHGSNTGVTAPLWNKVSSTATYQRYSSLGTATLDGSEVAVGSVSLACLSCHDGTQAMDVVVNAPGSGLYNASGSAIDGGAFTMTGTPIPNLGTDLRNDHPISIQYAGGGCGSVTGDCTPSNGSDTNDPDFAIAQYQSLNGQNQWWVDESSGTADTREKNRHDSLHA